MKLLVILCAVICASYADDKGFFKTADDYFDFGTLFKDKAKTKEYIDCFVGKGPCEPTPASYVLIIPEATRTACKRCNAPQKHMANVFLNGLRELHPEEYQTYVKKFDPEGIYIPKLLENVKDY